MTEPTRDPLLDLMYAAAALLDRLDHMTTEQFALGGERFEREALRRVLAGIERRTPTQTERH